MLILLGGSMIMKLNKLALVFLGKQHNINFNFSCILETWKISLKTNVVTLIVF
jgi:hypothetical protein